MAQQGQVFKLKTRGADGKPMWAYRYRVDGRRSARPQVGGFATQGEATQALQPRWSGCIAATGGSRRSR